MAESTDSQIAFMNGGGIRSGLEKGDITLGDIYMILPFDDTLVSIKKIPGKSIKAIMEHGLDSYMEHGLDSYGENKGFCVQFYGMKVVFDHSKPVGERVVSMTLNGGHEIGMDKYYSVCTNHFMFLGGDGYKFDGAIDVEVHSDLLIHVMLVERIKKRKILTLPEPDCLTDVCGQ